MHIDGNVYLVSLVAIFFLLLVASVLLLLVSNRRDSVAKALYVLVLVCIVALLCLVALAFFARELPTYHCDCQTCKCKAASRAGKTEANREQASSNATPATKKHIAPTIVSNTKQDIAGADSSNKTTRARAMQEWLSTDFSRPNRSRVKGKIGTKPGPPALSQSAKKAPESVQLFMYTDYVLSLKQKGVGIFYEPTLAEAEGKFSAYYNGKYVYLSAYIESIRGSPPEQTLSFIVDTNIPPASPLSALLSFGSKTTLAKVEIAPVSCNSTVVTLSACEMSLPAFFTVTYLLAGKSCKDGKQDYNYCR